MAGDGGGSLARWLPQSIISEIVTVNIVDEGFEAVLRAKISTQDDINRWMKEFSEYSMTQWIVRQTYPNLKRIKYRKDFNCHHSSFNKVKNENRKVDTVRHKDFGCKARISFKVKNDTRSTRRSDPYVKAGFYTEIILRWKHSHPIENAQILSHRRMNEETKFKLLKCFRNGLSASEAMTVIEDELNLLIDAELKLADGAFNPSKRQVYELFYKFRRENLGGRDPKLRKANNVTSMEDIIRIDEDIYLVPSSIENANAADANIELEDNVVLYEVNMKLALCSCPTGSQEQCCEHQLAVWNHYPNAMTSLPPASTSASYDEASVLAFESKASGSFESLENFYRVVSEAGQEETLLFDPEKIKAEPIDDEFVEPEGESNEAIIAEYCSAVRDVLDKYGRQSVSVRSAIERQLGRLQEIRSESQLASFLHNGASMTPIQCYWHKIARAEPTAAGTRRRTGVSRDSKLPVEKGCVARKRSNLPLNTGINRKNVKR